MSVIIGEAANGRAAIQKHDYFQNTYRPKTQNRKEIFKMTIVPFILEHVAKILDWTNDGYEAGIIRELAESLKHLY